VLEAPRVLLFLAAVAVFVAAMMVGSAIGAALASLVQVTWRDPHATGAIDNVSSRAMRRDTN
jgi:F0F1-type ATP synthase membrane subunit c/vacuolar-type H+-ATPase subunit K